MLADDFARAGRRTITKLRRRRPQDYLGLSAALLPKEFRIKEVELPDIPEAELDAMLSVLRKVIAEGQQQAGEGGQQGASGASPDADASS